jgi:hypothetical protein
MKKMIFGAIALTIAVPAFAQTAPAPEPKADCCEKMKAEGKECCCKDMAKKDHGMKQDHSPKTDGGAAHEGHGEHAQ